MEKLMDVENEGSDNVDASKVEVAMRKIEVEEMQCIGKASGLSGVVLEMFKADEDKCLKSLKNISNQILFEKSYQRNEC